MFLCFENNSVLMKYKLWEILLAQSKVNAKAFVE